VWFCDRDSSGILEDSSTAMYVNYDPDTEGLSWSIFVFQTADRHAGKRVYPGGLGYSARVSHLARATNDLMDWIPILLYNYL
jgi:hypothetical protein